MSAKPLNFRWHGDIAGMARPFVRQSSRDEQGEDDLVFLKEAGISAIVSLTETPLDVRAIRRRGFSYKHIPIADMRAPTPEQIKDFIDFVEKMRSKSKKVAVHCYAGSGRTGTMLACYLIHQGKTSVQAMQEVRASAPGAIETLEQELVVIAYEYERKGGDEG